MDDFFNSNPGFRSRVPFSFSFEDYTCPELVQTLGFALVVVVRGLGLGHRVKPYIPYTL